MVIANTQRLHHEVGQNGGVVLQGCRGGVETCRCFYNAIVDKTALVIVVKLKGRFYQSVVGKDASGIVFKPAVCANKPASLVGTLQGSGAAVGIVKCFKSVLP